MVMAISMVEIVMRLGDTVMVMTVMVRLMVMKMVMMVAMLLHVVVVTTVMLLCVVMERKMSVSQSKHTACIIKEGQVLDLAHPTTTIIITIIIISTIVIMTVLKYLLATAPVIGVYQRRDVYLAGRALR